jgi:hypothetical protein
MVVVLLLAIQLKAVLEMADQVVLMVELEQQILAAVAAAVAIQVVPLQAEPVDRV